MSDLRIAVIPGDGIGREVITEGIRVLERAASRFDLRFVWNPYNWSCESYLRTGKMMPDDALEQLRDFDAIYLGAVGFPGVPDHVSLWGLLLPIRRRFEQYINLRPCKLLPGVESPVARQGSAAIDLVIVRENTEGEYSDIGGRALVGTEYELVLQQSLFTRRGVNRVLRYAFELARGRPGRHVTSATKSNGLMHSMPYWDERFALMAAEYPDVRSDSYHVDILAAHFVRDPGRFDVVVASNLFGDILSDLGAAVAGSIGLAPSANINPEKTYPSMFEPVHGSAPDIAGCDIANPIAAILSGAMMLDHLGHPAAARAVEAAVSRVLAARNARTPDLGGTTRCSELGAIIAAEI